MLLYDKGFFITNKVIIYNYFSHYINCFIVYFIYIVYCYIWLSFLNL